MVSERAESIDKSTEWEEFMNTLRAYHEKRGTPFDPEPRVGQKRVDLLALYKRVMLDGGYDRVSDTKQMPLQWKHIGIEMGYERATHITALAFTIKTVYYRYLAAYEISTVHKKEPPPREILEDITAKGGNLLNRTIENYALPKKTTEDDEGQGTPNGADKMEVDGESSARQARGLRQAPPQRQLFQADASTIYRQSRHQGQRSSSPGLAGVGGGLGNLHNATAAQALANYEPRPSFPLSLRPVVTPASNPERFKANQAAIRDAHLARLSGRPPAPPKSNIMLPGTGFPGPSIYVRTWMALRSSVLEEQEYALHHLVKISHERGDKYRFDQFGGLVEALVDKLLETSSLFYETDWQLSFEEDAPMQNNVLDALNGTPDILSRLRRARRRTAHDKIETDDMTRRLRLINEAGLVIRNLVQLDENADYALRYPPTRDTLTIILTLPDASAVIETKHYALEIAEQLTKFMPPDLDDPLLTTLLAATSSSDRGVVLSSLRAIYRIGQRLDHVPLSPPLPLDIIQRLLEWLLVEDQDLRSAVLDVIYRYTANVDNVDKLMREFNVESVIGQLTRLLLHGGRYEESQQSLSSRQPYQTPTVPPTSSDQNSIPKISQDHIEMLLNYDEPERSSQWLRACFYEDVTGEITQIALWQAYQIPFTPHSTTRPLLPAKDFITNVSTTFTHATAQVIAGEQPKFIIKGIRPREIPVDPKGRPFMRCHWLVKDEPTEAGTSPEEHECGEFARDATKMWEHIVTTHLGVPKTEDGKFDVEAASKDNAPTCRWAGCTRYGDANPVPAENAHFLVGMHIKTHLPDSSSLSQVKSRHNIASANSTSSSKASKEKTRTWSTTITPHGERLEPLGLPVTACSVLRNLARNVPKTTFVSEQRARWEEDQIDAGSADALQDAGDVSMSEVSVKVASEMPGAVQSLFAPVMGQLYYVLAQNRSLGEGVSALLRLVEADS